jgi:predicted nuclease with TOPRIM domain
MKRVFVIVVIGLANLCFSEEVTNRQIFEKLIQMEAELKDVKLRLDELKAKVDDLEAEVKDLSVRIARLEEAQRGVLREMDALRGLIYVVLAGIFALVGFVLWDRRTTVSPTAKKVEEIERTLREYAAKEPKFAEVLNGAML